MLVPKRKTLQNYWPSSFYHLLFIYHVFSSSTAPEKPLVCSRNYVEKGFNHRGKNMETMLFQRLLVATSLRGMESLETLQSAACLCQSAVLRTELVWITCWKN